MKLPTPPGFGFRATVLSHGWLDLSPFAHDEEVTALYRVERLEDGTLIHLSFRGAGEGRLEVRVEGLAGSLSAGRREEISNVAGRIFHLDLDLSGFYRRLRGEDRYAWVEEVGAGRLLRSPTVWEDLVKTLLTTNTTWSGTRGMVSRLAELGPRDGDGLHAFPSPHEVAALEPGTLGDRVRAGYRTAHLHTLATAIAAGGLDVESWAAQDLPTAELYRRVTALAGFGPYAAGSVMRLLGHYDELALDSVARATFARCFNAGEPVPDAVIREHYEPYGKWRGLVLWMDVVREALDRRGDAP